MLPLWFEQMPLRPLTAEEIASALRVATGWGGDKLPGTLDGALERAFGNAVDGRGEFQASLTERLFVNNSAGFRSLIARKPGALWNAVAFSKEPMPERVDRLFLTVLSRPPRPEERALFAAHLAPAKTAAQDTIVEEAIWALLASAEFRFNR